MWNRNRLNNLFFLLGLATVVVMLFTFDVSFSELWQHLCHAGYWLVPIVGVWAVIYAINAWSWQLIVKSKCDEGEHVSFPSIYRLTIIGYALNYATPVGGLGGEPYRIMELSRTISKEHATSSVILYAMMHIYAHFWFWFVSIFLYLFLAAVGDLALTPVLMVLFFLAIVLCVTAFALFIRGYRHGVVKMLMSWVARIPGLRGWGRRFMSNHEQTINEVDGQIAALRNQDKPTFYRSFALEFFSRIVQSLEIFFMLLLFDIDCGGGFTGLMLTFLHSVLILSFTSLLANLIGFLPMQLGVQEGGFVLSIAALGLSAALGIFVSIICRVRELLWIALGLVLMKWK